MDNQNYLPMFIIRLGLSFVFLWFGIDKFIQPMFWASWMPKILIDAIPFSKIIFIYILGLGELILGVLLLIGLFTRLIALFVAIHLCGVIISIGFNDIAVRDFGLLLSAIALAINKIHYFSLDSYRLK